MSLTMDMVDTFDMSKQKPAYVTFETRAVEKKKESERKGYYVAEDQDFAIVRQPGSVDSTIWEVKKWLDQNKREVENGRLNPAHEQYYRQAYEHFKKGQEIPVEGTPIKTWPVISPAQVGALTALHIRTVEELANLPDDGVRRIGMGGIDLKNKAKAWLASAQDKGKVTQELAGLQAKNTMLEGTIETLQKQVKELEALVKVQHEVKDNRSLDIEEVFEEPKKRGK
jgi:hypothetical protein